MAKSSHSEFSPTRGKNHMTAYVDRAVILRSFGFEGIRRKIRSNPLRFQESRLRRPETAN